MTAGFFRLAAAGVLLFAFPHTSTAQTSSCRTAADTAGLLVGRLRIAFAKTVAPSAITLVTSSSTCDSAVAAYNQTRSAQLSSVYVVALGSIGYVVVNPADTEGEYTLMYIYDPQWVFKQAALG
jgi:hypothetical protein